MRLRSIYGGRRLGVTLTLATASMVGGAVAGVLLTAPGVVASPVSNVQQHSQQTHHAATKKSPSPTPDHQAYVDAQASKSASPSASPSKSLTPTPKQSTNPPPPPPSDSPTPSDSPSATPTDSPSSSPTGVPSGQAAASPPP